MAAAVTASLLHGLGMAEQAEQQQHQEEEAVFLVGRPEDRGAITVPADLVWIFVFPNTRTQQAIERIEAAVEPAMSSFASKLRELVTNLQLTVSFENLTPTALVDASVRAAREQQVRVTSLEAIVALYPFADELEFIKSGEYKDWNNMRRAAWGPKLALLVGLLVTEGALLAWAWRYLLLEFFIVAPLYKFAAEPRWLEGHATALENLGTDVEAACVAIADAHTDEQYRAPEDYGPFDLWEGRRAFFQRTGKVFRFFRYLII